MQTMTNDRETHLVELVDEAGTPLGAATVAEAHEAPGQLHRAFSVLLVDPDGRVLLQRRAASKTRFPLRWANTCCGHPRPDEPLLDAAALRLQEEIGVSNVALREVGSFVYQATDPASSRVEFEYDHVLIGTVPADLATAPDPAEVAELRWAQRAEVVEAVAAVPEAYSPWLGGVLNATTVDLA